MVDRIAGEPPLPDPDQDWQSAARPLALDTHHALLRHPWAIGMWQTRWPGPNRWLHMETLLAILATADFTEDHADLAFHAIVMHIQGFTQQQVSYATELADGDVLMARFAAEVDLILEGLARKG